MLFVRETSIVFRRQLRIALRNPAWVIIGLVQPLLYLGLFGPLLVPLASSFGADNAYTLFVPGLLVQRYQRFLKEPHCASQKVFSGDKISIKNDN